MDSANGNSIDIFAFGLSSIVFTLISRLCNNVKKDVHNNETCTTISAPGKALLAGGYLVLDHPNVGITIAASACFHTSVKVTKLPILIKINYNLLYITVESPQFYSIYEFKYDIQLNSLILIN